MFFKTKEVKYEQWDGQAKILSIVFCMLGALLMSIYKGPIIFKGLVLKAIPPNSMLPSKLFWEISIWGLKGGVLIMDLWMSFFNPSISHYWH